MNTKVLLSTPSSRLQNLSLRGRRQFGAKDTIPEATGDAETVLVVGEVVLEVVFFEFAPVSREAVWEEKSVIRSLRVKGFLVLEREY